jgi:hypothetical protein
MRCVLIFRKNGRMPVSEILPLAIFGAPPAERRNERLAKPPAFCRRTGMPKAGCTGEVAKAMDKSRVPGLYYPPTPVLAVFVPGAATRC